VLLIGLGGLAFTAGAVILEVISGQYANSAVPGWARWVPLAWPQPLRVAWWLAVAAGAGGFRWSLHRLGLRPSRVVTVFAVVPFLVFAAGIGVGADWAPWHCHDPGGAAPHTDRSNDISGQCRSPRSA